MKSLRELLEHHLTRGDVDQFIELVLKKAPELPSEQLQELFGNVVQGVAAEKVQAYLADEANKKLDHVTKFAEIMRNVE